MHIRKNISLRYVRFPDLIHCSLNGKLKSISLMSLCLRLKVLQIFFWDVKITLIIPYQFYSRQSILHRHWNILFPRNVSHCGWYDGCSQVTKLGSEKQRSESLPQYTSILKKKKNLLNLLFNIQQYWRPLLSTPVVVCKCFKFSSGQHLHYVAIVSMNKHHILVTCKQEVCEVCQVWPSTFK